jgi:hypothetical protein
LVLARVRGGACLFAAILLLAALASDSIASNCAGTSTGMIPLNDLGAGFYQGHQGGLYPGGSNARPSAHEAAGLTIANAIGPLDTLGHPDPSGRVVLISIGMSNATQEFSTFVPKAMNDPSRNPSLLVIDCAQGGQTAKDIANPAAAFWDTVAARLRRRGSSPLQAQVVWYKEAERNPSGGFPAATDTFLWDMGRDIQLIHQKLPNVRLCYITSRIYAGYASSTLNPEPYAYECGFAVKWLIEGQITGVDSLNFDPDSGAVQVPWLAWGPYLWADGLNARSDGLTWTCDEFITNDGTHPSASGREVVADSLLAFFESDATTTPWFSNHTLGVPRAGGDEVRFSVAPNPASGEASLAFRAPAAETWSLRILDVAGRRVRRLASGPGNGGTITVSWDGRSDSGDRVRNGLYWARLDIGSRVITRPLVRIGAR